MNTFEQIKSLTALLSNSELEALASKCISLVEDRQRIERNELRMQLMENLQKALSDILEHGFTLIIKNTERNHEYDDFDEVYFDPEDIYSVTIE